MLCIRGMHEAGEYKLSTYDSTGNNGQIFSGCSSLKKIEVPEGVTEIPGYAFNGCNYLEEVILPNTLETIGNYAFYECSALDKIWIDQNVTSIGNEAFGNCTRLTIHGVEGSYAEEYAAANSIPFSAEIMVYPTGSIEGSVIDAAGDGVQGVTVTFYDMTKGDVQETLITDENGEWSSNSVYIGHTYRVRFYHTDYEIAENVREYLIGEEAIVAEPITAVKKDSVAETDINDFTYTVLNGTYCQITGYTGTAAKVSIPSQINGYIVQSLGNNVFSGNMILTTVVFPESIETMGSYVFYGCTSLTDVRLNEGLTNIGSYAFSGCTALESITLPGTITDLGSYAFQGCSELGGVELPDGLLTIQRQAFSGCTALEEAMLPDSVEGIGYRVFENCTMLSSVNYPLNWSRTIGNYSYDGTGSNGQIFHGCSSLKKIEIPEGVTEIPSYAFNGCDYLEEVVLPSTLTRIGECAFYGCSGLKAIEIPESVSAMGNSAFQGCSGLSEIVLPGALETIPYYSFNGCTGLRSVTVSEGTTNIADYAFQGCTGLSGVELPDRLLTIQRQAFSGCTALEEVMLPDSVEGIGYRVFENCTGLNSVNYPLNWSRTISNYSYDDTSSNGQIFHGCSNLKKIEVPEGVTAIPDYAFNGCSYLEEIILPSTLTAIGDYAFYNCSALKTINLIEGLTAIPSYCFYNCTSLGELVLPSTVVSVGNYAYYNCIGLRTITMDEGLKSIGSYAFYGCDGVLSLVLNEGLETIANNAFTDCDNLKAVELPSSITSMGENVFDGCPKLTIYCYSGTQAHMVSESEGYTIYLLDEHEHEYTTTVETAPTCTRGGSQILTCSICGYYYVEILEPLGHDYSDTVVAPTCEEEGYTLHECTRCGDSYQDQFVPAAGHDYGEWETVTEATCTTDGSQKRVCKVCGNEEIQVIAALGHNYEEVVIPPTCTGQGCTVYTCSVCNESYGDNYIEALGHSFGEWTVTKEATILEYGTRTRTCSLCAQEETEEIDKITVDIENNSEYGLANFTVLDAMSLEPVSGASIFITTEKDGEATFITDEKGRLSQILPVGQWTVSVYADGYLVRNVKITVEAGEQDIPTIGISDKPLVDASITSKEMTYDEMLEAGIKVEANKHYYEYKVEIRFHETLDVMSFVSYGDDEGNIIATVSNNTNRTFYALSHNENVVEAEPVTVNYSEEYGTYIPDRSTLTNAVWLPTIDDKIDLVNNGYYFEGYGIPSTLTMTTDRAFPNNGWTYDAKSGKLSMSVGERTHYLTFRDGEFCTVSNSSDSIPINLFEKISGEGYPTGTDYVYVPADTFEMGKEYLLIQFDSKNMNNREALSHNADLPAHETVAIYGDDVYGDYIVDSSSYENAVWLSSTAKTDGLKIANNYYFAQVDSNALKYMPLANETGWKLDGQYLTTTIGDETFYLRYAYGEYTVTSSKTYAGNVMVFEKTTATDIIAESGQTDTKTIYRRVTSFESGKEYIIVGSSKNPSSNGGGGYSGSDGSSFQGTLSNGTPVTIYPVSEYFYLIIYGKVSWIKETFDVEMLILNNSSTDTIENCVAELILPEGLSLAAMENGEQNAVQTVDHIPENGSHSLHWYVCGDKEGCYNITATLSGTMMPFNEEFFYEYEADSPIKVYAGNAMKMTFYIPEAAYNGMDYDVKVELENVSDKVLYGVTSTITGWEEGKVTHYSDGRVVHEVYGSGGTVDSDGERAFYPGDKIVVEGSFEILFESSILNNIMESIDKSEQVYESYKAVEETYNFIKTLFSVYDKVTGSLNTLINSGRLTNMDKAQVVYNLSTAFGELRDHFNKYDSDAIKLANITQTSEIGKAAESCTDISSCEQFVMDEAIDNLQLLLGKIESAINETEEDTFNVFDSLRAIASNIPIRYVVDEVMVSTIGDSTATIPYSIKLTPVESPYSGMMGVDILGKLLYSEVIIAMGKISSPWPFQIFGAPDDLTGYDDAVAYVKQVESQVAAYSVYKSSDTKYEAWVEHASSANAGISTYSSGVADNNFLIETENETAAYVDGKLTFTGNAILEVTALSTEDGILYIKDDEGNVKTIVIDVLEAHTCHSDTWYVELAPSEEYDGYRAKCCDICGDIIAVETLSACSEHNFGDWIIEQESTAESMGIRYRECQNCYARETEYLPIIKDLFDMQLHQYGTGITVEVGGESLTNQQTVGIASGTTFTVASESECVVAYSTDSGETFSLLTGDLVSEENKIYQYALPENIENDISLYVVLRGDATGDGKIDIFDFYAILNHLENTDLTGIFYLAGCVTDDNSVDLFDAYAVLNYIKNGSFGE